MSLSALFLLLLGFGVIAFFTGRARAQLLKPAVAAQRPHSRPNYHGWYVTLWAIIPAMIFLAVWSVVSPPRRSQPRT